MLVSERRAVIQQLSKIPREFISRVESKPNWKDRETSNCERLAGNELLKKPCNRHDLEEVWDKYTQSIAWAPKDSEELALGYANRSALLLHVSKYQEAIVDIDRAIDITKSNALKVKWLCRKAKCLIYIECPSDAEKVLQEAELLVKTVDKDANKLIELIQNTRKLLTSNDLKPNTTSKKLSSQEVQKEVGDFSAVAIVNDTKNGRHLIATRNIEPGEFIFIEKPYISSILSYKSAHPFCSHCSTTCLTTIPCDSCCWCMYCSENCKNAAWSQYHDIECLALGDYLPEMVCGYLTARTAIFLIIRECRKAGGISNLKTLIDSIDKKKESSMTDLTKIKSSPSYEFESIYKTCCIKLHHKYIELHSPLTICMLLSLAKYTTFFGKKFGISEYQLLAGDDNVIFIGALFIKFLNKSTISELVSDRRHFQVKEKSFPAGHIGIFILNTVSLLKHNCNPNSHKLYLKDSNIAIYATKKIEKGDQIYDSFTPNCWYSDRPERQNQLKVIHNLTCNCDACKEHWFPTHLFACSLYMQGPELPMGFCKLPLERQLYAKHKVVIESYLGGKLEFECTEQVMKNLIQSLTRALKELPKSCAVICYLTVTLNAVMKELYGYHHASFNTFKIN